jgi:hypothetical protein
VQAKDDLQNLDLKDDVGIRVILRVFIPKSSRSKSINPFAKVIKQ